MMTPYGQTLLRRCLPLAVLGGLPLFFITGFSLTGSAFFGSFSSLGHTAYFAILTLSALPLIRRHWPGCWRGTVYYWLALSLLGFAFSLIIETIQHWVGRQFDWMDIALNLFGIWLVLLWWPESRPPLLARWPLQTLVLVILLMEGWQAARTFQDRTRLQQQQPLVFDQSISHGLNYWEGSVAWLFEWSEPADSAPSHSLPLVQLEFDTDRFSSMMLTDLPHDWSGYDRLTFDLYNPQTATVDLRLRINDHAHETDDQQLSDRFNRSLQIEPGWNTIEVALSAVAAAPMNRTMDMTTISRFGLFTIHLSEPMVLYLDDLRLR